MFSGGTALTQLEDRDLTRLLERVHNGTLRCPIGPAELHAAGLSYLCDKLDFLRGYDARTVHAILVAVIAERRRRG